MSDQRDGTADPALGGRRGGFASAAQAAEELGLEPGWREAARRFPMRWPARYLALASSPEGRAVRLMGAPHRAELDPASSDLEDPVGERSRSPVPYVVRKHRDRAILLLTSRCHFYCRFCFRRRFPDGGHRDPRPSELDAALEYLAQDPQLREVILSGGDPLVLGDGELATVLGRLAAAPRIEVVRLHTRAPVHYPERVTDRLLRVLASGPALWLVTHFNHPVELTAEARLALARLRRAGLPLLNQSVLLAGVNDSAEVLAELMTGLYREGVKPYYLHHPDRVPGNAAFRLPIERGLAIHAELGERVSGPALPSYVIDLPDGSGKVQVTSLERLAPGRYRCPASGILYRDSA